MLLEMTLQALHQMRRYKVSTALVVLGVAMGVANIIMLISISDLGKRQSTGLLKDFGATMLVITPFADAAKGMGRGLTLSMASSHMPTRAAELIAGLPEIELASGLLAMPAFATYGDNSYFTTVAGVEPGLAELFNHRAARGRWLEGADMASGARVACLGDALAAELFGAADPLGKSVTVKGQPYRVVGVMVHKGRMGLEDFDNRVFIPLPLVQEAWSLDGLHAVFAHYRLAVGEQRAVAAVKAALGGLVRTGENPDEVYTVFTLDEARRLFDQTMGIFRVVLAGISSIAMLVAGIGIMNVMLIRVMQRRKEIGVRRAVGATPRLIAAQFLLESVLQASAGAVLGILLGIAGVHVYCRYAQWPPYVNPLTVILAALFSAAVGLVFGAYPALRASRADPIVCLRLEP